MKTEKPLVDKIYQLEKIGDNGGWTIVEIPEIPMPKTPFGMMKVKGKIDDHEFSNVNLMPLGNGNLMMAIKSEIRKKIKKQAPDMVHLTLYEDNEPFSLPDELILCMGEEKEIIEKFEKYSDGQKKAFVKWIYAAKTEQTKAKRIAKTIVMIQNGEKFY